MKAVIEKIAYLHMVKKDFLVNTKRASEKAVLVGLITRHQNADVAKEYLNELEFLATTAGALTIKRFVQHLDHSNSKTYVGSGKLIEIAEFVDEKEIDMVIFDDELSPGQIRNIEKELDCKVLDRANLILDIFASRAKTAQARAQVELAQNQYLLPRLTRMWTHLSKQKGGIGMKGPGEKEIETDRRIIRDRISLLKEKLAKIDKQASVRRKGRNVQIRVALVGYTNVGKSTLMNLLSKSDLLAEDKLFATLDSTVRKVVLGRVPFLLSDTVGFIRKLPHHLIESFKSTLDEVREADLLLHVVDLSHPNFEEQINIVNQTLQELGVAEKQTIMLFNKIDKVRQYNPEIPHHSIITEEEERPPIDQLEQSWISKDKKSVFISATAKQNTDKLRDLLTSEVKVLWAKKYPYYHLPY